MDNLELGQACFNSFVFVAPPLILLAEGTCLIEARFVDYSNCRVSATKHLTGLTANRSVRDGNYPDIRLVGTTGRFRKTCH